MLPAAQPVSSKLWGPRFCLIFSEKRWEPLHVMPARESVISARAWEREGEGRRGVRTRLGRGIVERRGEGTGGRGEEGRGERRERREEREERREPFCSRASKSSKPAALEMCASLM